jgi:S1-C subfamily serine protease
VQYARWLRRTGWGVAVVIALSAAWRSLVADDRAAVDKQGPASEEAAPAAGGSKEAKRAKNVAKPQGRVLIPKYRLGAALAPVPPALNNQLDLKGEGLLIQRVAPDGPAHKAGIKRDDILLTVGDKPIKKYGDLVEASNASGGKMSLKLMRGGTTVIVVVRLDKHRKGDEKMLIPGSAVGREESEEPIKEKMK